MQAQQAIDSLSSMLRLSLVQEQAEEEQSMIHKPKKELTDEEMGKILEAAKSRSFLTYVAIRTLTVLDLRRSEMMGQDDKREWPNNGMLIEKLTPKGIWIRRKKQGVETEIRIPAELRADIDKVIGKRTNGSVFLRTAAWLYAEVQICAKLSGIANPELVHPHTLRHWMTSYTGEKHGVIVARDLAGHASIATTNTYLRRTRGEKLEEVEQGVLELLH